MHTAARKDAAMSNDERKFPPEVYDQNDDVTPEGVDFMRKRAAKVIGAEEWEVVDGFRLTNAK